MANRYIDVDRLCNWLKNLKSGFTKDELVFRDELIEHLKGNNGIANVLPQVDVVPVVRCKDCKRFADNREAFVTHCRRELKNLHVKPDDFCSYGERRSDG